ncbi:MAG: hypothetical protein Q8N23_35625 [Archangium sp.]|nr:hypothetical protein [Archangium sp.]MDP3570538.1 hypothetical protein [Archangium sp.]
MRIEYGAAAAWVVMVFALSGCPRHTPLRDSAAGDGPQLVFAIADPQIHNIYGSSLLLGSGAADLGVQVARRRAELNILAPFVFRHFLEQGLAKDPVLTLVLGDLTNVGCTGEYDTVLAQLNAASQGKPGLVLFAHGNHDTYLMGITNQYVPYEAGGTYAQLERDLKMSKATAPTDESWWPDLAAVAPRAWPSACSTHDGRGKPLNKVQWMARYLAHLEQYGVAVESTGIDGGFKLASTNPGRDNLQVEGEWYRPDFKANAGLLPPYDSFLVQSLDRADYRVIIIDTSVCAAPTTTISGSAGSRGCIGEAQFTIIERLLSEAKERPVVLAGHFNLGELTTSGERARLIKLIEKHKATYLSAHTHADATLRSNYGVREINVGSTTDWPMSAQVLVLADGQVKRRQELTLPVGVPAYEGRTRTGEAFSDLLQGQPFEVCRHLAAARVLAGLQTPFPAVWLAPPTDADCRGEETNVLQLELKGLVDTIEKRIVDEPAYRAYVLNVAAAASAHDQCKLPVFLCPLR